MPNQRQRVFQQLLQLASSLGGRQLPSIRALAADWGASPRTVQLAVQQAVQQGALETRPGSGIWPKGHLPKLAPPVPKLNAVRLAQQIADEIRAGKHESNRPFPSPKDLAKQTNAHPATIRKAFGILEAQDLAQRHGRVWKAKLPHGSTRTSAPVVLCIGDTDTNGNLRIESDREWDFWREIQMEALCCGLEPRLLPWNGTPLPLDHRCFGAIVSNWHMPTCDPILDELLRARLPTSVWTATEESLPGKRYQDVRGMWFHNLAHGKEAGIAMGQFLSSTGHRKIAWISPFHGNLWSPNRLDGLKSSMGKDVEVFEAVHDWESEWDLQVQIAWAPETLRRVDLEGLDGLHDPDALRRPLAEALTRQRCLEIFGPKLEQALASGATLWVAGSDLIARWSLHWLARRGIAVPRDLAMVSFDDTRDASRLNLSSLRFDVQSMARAMIRQVLSSKQEHKRVTRYAGFVVARESTRREG